jgi:hypothetical protein
MSVIRRGVTEAFAIVGCHVANVGTSSWLPTFQGGTGSLSCSVSNQLPAYFAERPRGTEVSRFSFFQRCG